MIVGCISSESRTLLGSPIKASVSNRNRGFFISVSLRADKFLRFGSIGTLVNRYDFR